jgi:hypothetical protein
MLDLAIPMDENRNGETIVETNHGKRLVAPDWPSDYEFRLVAFSPKGRVCKVVDAGSLSEDIAQALMSIDRSGNAGLRKTDWYRRLTRYSRGSDDQ